MSLSGPGHGLLKYWDRAIFKSSEAAWRNGAVSRLNPDPATVRPVPVPSALRLVLVSCAGCGRRNKTDFWLRLRGRRARCGSCGRTLPLRVPFPLLLAVVVASVLIASLGLGLQRVASERRARSVLEQALAEARASRVDEALALTRDLDPAGDRDVRSLLIASVVRDLERALEPGTSPALVESAHRRADDLVAGHGESWPDLVRALEPITTRLRSRREVSQLVAPLRAAATEGGADLEAFSARLMRAEREARRLGDEAARTFSLEAAPAWDEAVLTAARASARAGRMQAARASLDSPGPLGPSAKAVAGPPRRSSESPGPTGKAEDLLATLRAASRDRDLEGLRWGVRLRAEPAWSTDQAGQLERELPTACRALASLAADRARDAAEPETRLALLLDAVTCDELLPSAFLARAHAAIARERVARAEGGGPWPDPQSLGGDESLLVRLACAADSAGRPGLTRSALRASSTPSGLAAGLSCDRWTTEPIESEPAAWPALDYPSLATGEGEESP